jgi:hypothetical protein
MKMEELGIPKEVIDRNREEAIRRARLLRKEIEDEKAANTSGGASKKVVKKTEAAPKDSGKPRKGVS